MKHVTKHQIASDTLYQIMRGSSTQEIKLRNVTNNNLTSLMENLQKICFVNIKKYV